jgi:hypothetical protein
MVSPTCPGNRHGTANDYRNGCRCPEALALFTRGRKERDQVRREAKKAGEMLDADPVAIERALADIAVDVPLSVRLTRAERNEVIRGVPVVDVGLPNGLRNIAEKRLKVSGTTWDRVIASVHRHRANGEPLCDACVDAKAATWRRRRDADRVRREAKKASAA